MVLGAGTYSGLYLQYLQKPACTVAPPRTSLSVTARQPLINCDPGYYPLNGSIASLYNSTTMNDDVAWAATWMYRCVPLPNLVPNLALSAVRLSSCCECCVPFWGGASSFAPFPSRKGWFPEDMGPVHCYWTCSNRRVLWAGRATGDQNYLNDAEAYLQSYAYSDESVYQETLLVDWNNNYWNTALLLAQLTDKVEHHYVAQNFLRKWICSSSDKITYTKRGRAWNAAKGESPLPVLPVPSVGRMLKLANSGGSQGCFGMCGHLLIGSPTSDWLDAGWLQATWGRRRRRS